MTSFERFENRLPAMLDQLAVPRLPDYADDLFARTAATRQRPGWTFLERWLPMSTLTQRLAVVPRIPWRLGVLVALLAIAALIAVLVSGSFFSNAPAPYGPAGNGKIAFIDDTGRVVFGDLATNTSKVIADVTGSSAPLISQDGSRVAFLHKVGLVGGSFDLMVAPADGTSLSKLSAKPISSPTYVGWSAHGDRILVVDAGNRMLVFDAARTGAPVNLSDQLKLGPVSIGLGYNYRSTAAFQPPNGDAILFMSKAGGDALKVVRPDGTGLRTLLDAQSSPVAFTHLAGAEWSPDGSQIVVMLEFPGNPDKMHIHVLNADGTGLHPLSAELNDRIAGQNSPLWSPDGTRIAFQNWTENKAAESGQDYYGIGIADVDARTVRYVGPTDSNGYISWEWSPDGKSILEVPADPGSDCSSGTCRGITGGSFLIVDATGGAITTAPWKANESVNWQRIK
jgi:Tol biopolymer transport system component